MYKVLACDICLSMFILFVNSYNLNRWTILSPLLYCFRYYWWLVGYPFTVILFVHEEIRKYIVHRFPDGWFAKNTVSLWRFCWTFSVYICCSVWFPEMVELHLYKYIVPLSFIVLVINSSFTITTHTYTEASAVQHTWITQHLHIFML